MSLMDSPALHRSHNSFLPAADNPPGRPSLATHAPPIRTTPKTYPVLHRPVEPTGSFFGRYPVATRIFYERALEDESAVAAASVAVEKINGPVLVISGTDDQVWPSTRLSERMIERLKAHDHPFPYEHLRYEGAGHMITLPRSKPEMRFRRRFEVGGSREANEFADADSWSRVVDFLEKHLKHRSK